MNGWIELTDGDGRRILINLAHVEYLEPSLIPTTSSQTEVCLSREHAIPVKEPYETVVQLVRTALS